MSHPESPPPRPPVNLIPDPGAPGGHEDLGAVFVLGSTATAGDPARTNEAIGLDVTDGHGRSDPRRTRLTSEGSLP